MFCSAIIKLSSHENNFNFQCSKADYLPWLQRLANYGKIKHSLNFPCSKVSKSCPRGLTINWQYNGSFERVRNLIVSLNFTPLFVSIKIFKLHPIYPSTAIVVQTDSKFRQICGDWSWPTASVTIELIRMKPRVETYWSIIWNNFSKLHMLNIYFV